MRCRFDWFIRSRLIDSITVLCMDAKNNNNVMHSLKKNINRIESINHRQDLLSEAKKVTERRKGSAERKSINQSINQGGLCCRFDSIPLCMQMMTSSSSSPSSSPSSSSSSFVCVSSGFREWVSHLQHAANNTSIDWCRGHVFIITITIDLLFCAMPYNPIQYSRSYLNVHDGKNDQDGWIYYY